jgi:hypothetical protein
MGTRVEFKDGTEIIYKDSNMWMRDTVTGCYRIQKRVYGDEPKTVHTSKLFSRKVKSFTPKRKYKDNDLAFIEISEVVCIEEIK